MSDHIYRMATIWQNVSYNQPPYLGYWLPGAAVLDKEPLTDSIAPVISEDLQPSSETYNLLGQRVNENKGIVIKKGKKWANR